MHVCNGRGLNRIDALRIAIENRSKGLEVYIKFCSKCNLFHLHKQLPPRS